MAAAGGKNDANTESKTLEHSPGPPVTESLLPQPKSKRPARWFSAWGMLSLHAGVCLAIALAIALAVNGYEALDDQAATHAKYIDGRLILRVSDVTTLVSAALVIVKLFVSWWTTLAVHACANHFFPETLSPTPCGDGDVNQDTAQKATTGDIDFMRQWKLPPWLKPPFALPRRPGQWTMTFALVAGAGQVLIAPVLSGATNWTSVSVTRNTATGSVAAVSPQADFSEWYWYNYPYTGTSYGLGRRPSLRMAAGYASLAWADLLTVFENGTSRTGNGCRHLVTSNDAMGLNSTLLNALLPCINIHSIQWYNASDSPSRVQTNLVLESYDLSIVNDAPFYYYNPGVAVMYDPNHLWNNSQVTSVKPDAVLYTGQQTLWMLVQRQPWQNPPCSHLDPTIFGSVDSLGLYNYSTGDKVNSNCYFFGRVNFTAGVTVSPQSTYLSSRVVEDQTPLEDVVFEASPWTQESLWLLPDLMTMISVMNSTLLPTYDNIDGYVEALVRQAYLAAWDMYHDSFDEDERQLTYTALQSVSRQLADVSFARVFGWLGICLLMTLTGIFLLAGVLAREDLELSKDEYQEAKQGGKSDAWEGFKASLSGFFGDWISSRL